jgi:hypothetical protein
MDAETEGAQIQDSETLGAYHSGTTVIEAEWPGLTRSIVRITSQGGPHGSRGLRRR